MGGHRGRRSPVARRARAMWELTTDCLAARSRDASTARPAWPTRLPARGWLCVPAVSCPTWASWRTTIRGGITSNRIQAPIGSGVT